jgi:hypothetical protein
MADYYSLLSKAVSNLPKAGPEPARKAIYDRARKALVRQLRSLGPTLSEADIAREEAALETAIGRLEGQFSSASTSPARPASPPATGSRPADGAGRPASFSSPPRPAPAGGGARIAMPDTPLARPIPPLSPSRPTSTPDGPGARPPIPTFADRFAASSPPARPGYPPPSAPTRPTLGAAGAATAPSARVAPLAPRPSALAAPSARAAPPRRVEASNYLPEAPSLGRVAAEDYDDDDSAPQVGAADDFERSPYTPGDSDALRPSAPTTRLEGSRRSAAPWILLALVLGIALSVAIFAFLWRQKPQDLAIKEPVETPSVQATANPAKIVERVAGAATPAPAPTAAPAPTLAPAVAPAAAPTPGGQTPIAAATPAPAATPAANAAPAPAASATPQTQASPGQASPGVAVAARAAMLVAVASDPQKPAVSLGSVVWSEIPAAAGQPSSVAVKAEADIPDLKMHAVMTMRKNTDPSLPASHTIELRVSFADGADIKGIKDMRVPMMRRDDPPSQDPLAGVRVKISDSYFLIGLNRGDAEIAHNIDLIANRGWFDFPLLLNDDRIAKLTFEKGAEGERIINEALAAWK